MKLFHSGPEEDAAPAFISAIRTRAKRVAVSLLASCMAAPVSVMLPTESAAQTTPYGVVDGATITAVLGEPLGTGAFFVYVNLPWSGGAACSTVGQVNRRFAIDPNSAPGKATISVILTAWISGHAVKIVGSGACDVWGDTESVAFVLTE